MKTVNPAMSERPGLIPKSPRTKAEYRTFTDETIQRLRFIKNAQALGLTLSEIKPRQVLRVTRGSACPAVRRSAQAKMGHMDGKITSLEKMKEVLQKLIKVDMADKPTAKCSFLTSLDREGISS